MAATGIAESLDGRRMRRETNREAVLDALIALFAEGTFTPSAAEIAERAGLSQRSLFRYFADVDDLARAAIDRQLATIRSHLDLGVAPAAPLAARIEALVAARARMFDAIAPGARAARVCAHRNPLVAAELAQARARLRAQLRQLFANEFAGERAGLLAPVDALCSFETYELLRFDQRLSRPKAAATMTRTLAALLGSQ